MKNVCSQFILILGVIFLSAQTNPIGAQNDDVEFVVGDALPDAPALAARGQYHIGVQTLHLINKNQVDILHAKDGKEPLYDRPLTVEIWYPSRIDSNAAAIIEYEDVLGVAGNPERPLIPFSFKGRAVRDTKPIETDESFPLVIVSHGYVGSRFLMTYLTENLASKGYIVVAIDHTESTFKDAAGFQSTLLNRSKDILFLVNEIADLTSHDKQHSLAGKVDANKTAIIGYSMGGYGALNAAGAGYSDFAINFFKSMTGGSTALASRSTSNESFKESLDPRIKAVVAFAPWGMERGVWDAEGLKGLKTPTFFIAGSEDDISGYEKGIKAIYEGVIHADRYLLTYDNARHNVAPNPPHAATMKKGLHIDEYYRYAEPSWNERRINNINQHFITAFLGIHLKDKDHDAYLNLAEDSNEKTWFGFVPRSSTGLSLLHATASEE